MNNHICFATAFYHANGNAPNLKNSTNKFDKYYQCMFVLFASIRKYYKEEKCVIFTDSVLPEKYNNLIKVYNIQICVLDQNEITLVDAFNNKFPGCLFTLDVINIFQNKFPDYHLLLLDSDVVLTKSIDTALNKLISSQHSSGIIIEYPITKSTNGYSRIDLADLASKYSHTGISPIDFKYFGGELYFIHSSMPKMFVEEINQFISFAKQHKLDNLTEEHILSIIFNLHKDNTAIFTSLIKRVWTTDTYHNIDGFEIEYAFLHLPSEKDKLFKKIFNLIEKKPRYLDELNQKQYDDLVLEPLRSRQFPSLKKKFVILVKKLILKFKG